MATGKVVFQKIPLGDPGTPVTADQLDRIQQAISQMAATIPTPAAPNVVTVGANYTVKGTEDILHVSSQLSPVQITLLQPSSSNRPLTIKQVDLRGSKTATNPVTIVTPDGSNTIAGKPSIALDNTGTGSVSISADNSQHWPSTSSGGNPPVAPAGSGTVYVAGPGIIISGNVISAKPGAGVTNVGAIAPLLSSGGTSPVLSLSIDGSLTVTAGSQLSLSPLSGDVVTISGSNNTTIQPHVVSYGKIQQVSAVSLLGNPTGVLANVSEITLGAGLSFVGTTLTATGGGGTVTTVTGTAPIFITSTPTTTPNVTIQGAVTTGGTSTSPTNLGALASGVLEQTVAIGVSTPSVFAATTNRVTLGGASGGLTDSANLMFNGSKLSVNQSTFDSPIHVVMTDDTTPVAVAAWDSRHSVFGQAGSTGGGLGISYGNAAATVYLTAAVPNAAFIHVRFDAADYAFYSSGTVLGLHQDASGNVYDALLTTNGLLKTSGGTGLHAIATSGDVATTLGFPASPQVLVSSGTTTAPTGSTKFVYDTAGDRISIGQSTFDSNMHVVLADDTTPGSIAAWGTRHAVFGKSGSTGGAAAFSYGNAANTVYLSAAIPGTSFSNFQIGATTFAVASNGATIGLKQDSSGNVYDSILTTNGLLKTSGGTGLHAIATSGDVATALGFPPSTDVLVSSGTTTAPVGDATFTFDTTNHLLAAGSGVGINGAGVVSNVSLVLGTTTNVNRDRALFFVGGGALGATGTNDNTLFDITPGNTTIRAGVTAGIYATQRIRAVTYAGASSPTITRAATLYIDDAPTIGGGIGGGGGYAIYVASGTTLVNQLTATSLTAGGITAVDTTGHFGIAGTGGLPAAVSGEQNYYINVAGSTLVTGGAVWLGTSSTAGQGGTALEYVKSFAATNVSLKVRIITNAITSGTLAIQITRNGSSFSTITLNNVSSGTVTTGTVTVGSPSASDQWGVLASGSGTGMTGNMVFTASLLLAPNVF